MDVAASVAVSGVVVAADAADVTAANVVLLLGRGGGNELGKEFDTHVGWRRYHLQRGDLPTETPFPESVSSSNVYSYKGFRPDIITFVAFFGKRGKCKRA